MKKLRDALPILWEDIIRPLSGPVGVRLRRAWYQKRFQHCGARLTIEPGVHIVGARFISFGDDAWIDRNVILIAGPLDASAKVRKRESSEVPVGRIVIGHCCHLGVGTIIQGHGGVRAGDFFTTSAGCKLYSVSNDVRRCRSGTMRTASTSRQPEYIVYPIDIGSNVWLGLDVKVIGHVIGSDVFVKPGSVVAGNLPANVIAEGSPAVAQSSRFPDSP